MTDPIDPVEAARDGLRRWVLNETGSAPDGAWSDALDWRIESLEAALRASDTPGLREAAAEMVQAYIDAEAGNEFNARMEAAWEALRAALSSPEPKPK